MCGRFSFATTKEKIVKNFEKLEVKTVPEPSYNIAPTQLACVITNEKQRAIQTYNWGLIPYWAKNHHGSSNLINARAEGINSKPSFRIPIRKRRCLVLADSFYEWRKQGSKKIPFRISMKNDELMAFAGIWDNWISPSGAEIKTFAIITTSPNKEMSDIHDRMPVLLTNQELRSTWLSDVDLETTLSLLRPVENDTLKIYSISPSMNTVSFNSSECHKPYNPPLTLFDQF